MNPKAVLNAVLKMLLNVFVGKPALSVAEL